MGLSLTEKRRETVPRLFLVGQCGNAAVAPGLLDAAIAMQTRTCLYRIGFFHMRACGGSRVKNLSSLSTGSHPSSFFALAFE